VQPPPIRVCPSFVRWRTIGAVLAAGALTGCAATGTTATVSRTASVTASAAATVGHPTAAQPAMAQAPTPTPNPAPPTPARPAALLVAPPSAAALPQTRTLPSTTDTAFKNLIHDFWLAVITGNPDYAKPAFFPEKAYQQVKAIADPNQDWQTRLWDEFALDVKAVRPLIGRDARLVKVIVPMQYAIWVPPGACYNDIGYWHVPGARVVYERGGVTRSFGITSLISWRGDWYLVHLGAYSRTASVGIVDDAEPGQGVPGPPGGC
jgi:hypothetical protein